MKQDSKKIIVLDDHFFRGAGVAAVISRRSDENAFQASLMGVSQVTDSQGDGLLEGVAACVYVIGGRSISDSGTVSIVKHCLAILGERPLVVLVDEIDVDCIDLAIALGIRGVIPTHMTADVALGAIQFIMVGGHYYPHSISQSRQFPASSAASCNMLGTPKGNSVSRSEVRGPDVPLSSWGFEAPESGQHLPIIYGNEDERSVELRVGGRKLHLTPRQIDVMQSLERGLSNKAIGLELDLSESTIKLHVRHLMRKLEVTNRTQIALLASSANWEPARS